MSTNPSGHMRGNPGGTRFGSWLQGQLEKRELSVRGFARDIAADYPGGATPRNVETVRRALNKYLKEGRHPSRSMRLAIAKALGVDESMLPVEPERPDPLQETFLELARGICASGRRDVLLYIARELDIPVGTR